MGRNMFQQRPFLISNLNQSNPLLRATKRSKPMQTLAVQCRRYCLQTWDLHISHLQIAHASAVQSAQTLS